MKTKSLLFCLLFLVLGTTTALADKYYTVKKERVINGALEFSTGKKYMIFNTTYNGEEPRYGFLYNMGTTFGVQRSTSVDNLIYNGAFVFELEDAGDDDPHTFYLKSTASSGYFDVYGNHSATPTLLKIYTWDEAQGKDDADDSNDDVYTVAANSVDLNDKNKLKQECVKSLNAGYTVVTEANVTYESNQVYLLANADTTLYFNGNNGSYAYWSKGHPFAFYECEELTSVGSFDITDLHIYSRADLFSAQKMYGYIKDASSQITTNYPYNGNEGNDVISNLVDGDFKTYHTTDWRYNNADSHHYYQIDLETSVSSLRLYMARRPKDGNHAPLNYQLLATNDPGGEWTPITLQKSNTSLDSRLAYTSDVIELGESYRYIRIQAPGEGNRTFKKDNPEDATPQCLALSELYVLPNREDINNAINYFDNTLPIAASEAVFKDKIDTYNKNAASAKLFSGVPIPGNKYRIYADAYSAGSYVNRDISVNADGTALCANESYHSAADQELFEWFCEESTDGKLLFRNVKHPTLYLSNMTAENVTGDIEKAKWTINTNLTQRHGVPLLNGAMQYLTVYNTGTHWMGDVKCVQNQTKTTGSADIRNTPDDTTDDIDLTDSQGLCTDFVFIPVDLDNDEISITITASELANRNSTLTVDGTVYEIPFSKVFYDGIPEITVTSTAGEFHTFTGFYKGDEKIGDVINSSLYTAGKFMSGDVIEARFEVAKLPDVSTEENIILYRIKNRNGKAELQNAGMSRTDIPYDDDFTSMEGGKYYYASFVSKDEPLELLCNDFQANSFFYFTNSEAVKGEDYQVYIHSAVTTFRSSSHEEWTSGGALYYIQPNALSNNKYGFAITRTRLDASNEPGAWNAEYTDAGNRVTSYNVEDGNSAWEFVPVDVATATAELKEYINKIAIDMIDTLLLKKDNDINDDAKIENTIDSIEVIAGTYTDGTLSNNGKIETASVTELVGYAQELHMLHHKIEYAMQALPEATDEGATVIKPNWYLVKNVETGSYARYNGADNLMGLTATIDENTENKLNHLFYFAGEVPDDVAGTKDEYLQAHIHNFMALNLKDASKDSTIVSYNKSLYSASKIEPATGGEQTYIDLAANPLKKNEAWQIELNYDLANGAFFNGWGSGLLASGGNGTATQDGGNYNDGFQVYLQNSGNVVIRGGDSGASDVYKFTHTVGKYATLKIVLTYANYRLQVAVTNSDGITQTIKDTPRGSDNNRDYIPCTYMMDVKKLASAMAGSSSFDINAEVVLAMKWNTHAYNTASNQYGDTWYILPSSNTTNPGLAIVSDSADDTNVGWNNVGASDSEIFTASGVDDYSTWQFEKVDNFEDYIDELLALYDIKDCIIYNEKLATLYKTLSELKAGEQNEATFNAMLNAIREYSGPTPEEFKAPKPGSFYTIRPAEDEKTKNALLVHVDRQNTHYATTELYKGVAVDNAGDTDSRAVWIFEGNNIDKDGFYVPTGLKAKNIHTLTYLGALGADATKLAGTGTAIALAPLGACTTSFKVGDTYMSATGDAVIAYNSGSRFWGYALDEYPSGLEDITKKLNDGEVRGKSFEVTVETAGAVTVTFTHNDGAHKLNILGVTLNNAGGILNGVYRHGTAGGNPTTQTYELGNVEPGTYTIHCYVWNFDAEGGENDKVESAQGNITITGISSVASITNTGTENTKWIVEEILDPEADVCYTTTIEKGYSTVMLGFDAKIPTGIEAYYGATDGIVIDKKYLSMEKYEGNVLPAQAPVVLKNSDEGVTVEDAKFFYSKIGGEKQEDNYLNGKLWYTIVPVEEGKNLYMLQQDKTGPKMYWIYEEYNAAGDKFSPGADDGGCVACKANKAYILIDNGEAQSNGVFLFSFRPGETTGIYNIADEKYRNENGSVVEGIFDLQGRKLSEITQPGIYIVNGKKVIIK